MTLPARFHRPLAATAIAATALLGASAAATHAAAAPAPTHGITHLNTQVNLPAGAWTNIPLQVVLPRAGTYAIDADVRGRLAGTPSLNTYISARLWNATTGTAVPQSERLVYQIIDGNAGSALAGGNATASIDELVRVTRPTTITLQARDLNSVGAASIAQIYSDSVGYTSLRFDRIGP